MKNILLLFLLSALASCVAVGQCPGPPTRTALINLQKALEVEGTRAGQIPLTDECGNQRYAQYTEINLEEIDYTPAATGNTQNLSEFVITESGEVYYIDWQGRGLLIDGGAASGDKDWLENDTNLPPDNIQDTMYTKSKATFGARFLFPGSDVGIIDSLNPATQINSGFRQANYILWNNLNESWSQFYHFGAEASIILGGGSTRFSIKQGTGNVINPTPGLSLADFNFFDSTITLPTYPNTRRDTDQILNILHTTATGKVVSAPLDSLVAKIIDSGGGIMKIDTFHIGTNRNWIKPAGASGVYVILIAGGGGAAGGAKGNAAAGGQGGTSGARGEKYFPASVISDTVKLTVGRGGNGGAGRNTDGGATNGTVGTPSFFGKYLSTGIQTSVSTGGSANFSSGAAGGAGGTSGGVGTAGFPGLYASASGGGGGGASNPGSQGAGGNSNTTTPSTTGMYYRDTLSVAGGASGISFAGVGQPGTLGISDYKMYISTGGGGGGAGAFSGGVGGRGGPFGGGAGGGGATLAVATNPTGFSGAGGRGGDGFIAVISISGGISVTQQIDSVVQYVPGAGISIVGTTISNTGDLSTSNELNTAFAVSGGNLNITDPGGTLSVPLSSLQNTYTAGTGINISGGNVISTNPSVAAGTFNADNLSWQSAWIAVPNNRSQSIFNSGNISATERQTEIVHEGSGLTDAISFNFTPNTSAWTDELVTTVRYVYNYGTSAVTLTTNQSWQFHDLTGDHTTISVAPGTSVKLVWRADTATPANARFYAYPF